MGGDVTVDAAIIAAKHALSADALIGSVVDASTARTAEVNMDKLKKMLDLADEYGNYASEYCTKEAELYIHIAGIIGAERELSSTRKRLVEWIRSKSNEELQSIIEECKSGCRIATVMNREIREDKKIAAGRAEIEEYKRISSQIIREYNDNGRTELTTMRFFDGWSLKSNPDVSAAKAFTEKTRDALLHRGGVGVADGNGTYINPDCCNRHEVAAAVETRLRSIHADLIALAEICERTRFSIPPSGVKLLEEQLERLRVPEND